MTANAGHGVYIRSPLTLHTADALIPEPALVLTPTQSDDLAHTINIHCGPVTASGPRQPSSLNFVLPAERIPPKGSKSSPGRAHHLVKNARATCFRCVLALVLVPFYQYVLSFEGGDVLLPLNAGSRSLVALGATQNTGTHAHQRRGSAPRFPAITAFSEPIEPQRVWTHGGAPSLARIRYVNFGVSPRKQSLVLPHPASSYRHSNLSRPGQSLPSNRTGFP